jgi:pimeloyl-ACP methyl ester carboxylesterase
MAKDASEAEEEAMIAGLLKDSAEKWDVQLQYYNSVESAQDLGELMDHLNYVKYNIFGVSYGTRLAREVQDRFPERINTVILDSPNPIKGDFLVDRLLAYSLALERVFAYCGENLECRQDYPNLRERYMNAIKAISRRPITIDDSGSKFVVNSQDAIYFLRRKLYANDSREAIPRMIAEYENGGGPLLEELVKEAFTPDYNYSMWLAVERYEMYNAANTPERIEALYDSLPLLPATLGLFTGAYLAMPMLHESSLPEERKAYAVSEVPTLITVNHFDPVTPPENGHILMRNLAKGKLYILNEGGHGGGDYECLDKFMVEFMDSPDEKPDTSCLNIYVEKKRR